jgi:hypothetical protein
MRIGSADTQCHLDGKQDCPEGDREEQDPSQRPHAGVVPERRRGRQLARIDGTWPGLVGPLEVRNALLAAMLSIIGVTAPATATPPPIVLMVVLDGARADGSGCLDVGRYVAPTVQRLCNGGDGGIAFARAYAQSSSARRRWLRS